MAARAQTACSLYVLAAAIDACRQCQFRNAVRPCACPSACPPNSRLPTQLATLLPARLPARLPLVSGPIWPPLCPPACLQVYQTVVQQLGPDHPGYIDAVVALAELHRELGQQDEADK